MFKILIGNIIDVCKKDRVSNVICILFILVYGYDLPCSKDSTQTLLSKHYFFLMEKTCSVQGK